MGSIPRLGDATPTAPADGCVHVFNKLIDAPLRPQRTLPTEVHIVSGVGRKTHASSAAANTNRPDANERTNPGTGLMIPRRSTRSTAPLGLIIAGLSAVVLICGISSAAARSTAARPDTPTGLTLTAAAAVKLTIAWTAVSSQGSPVVGYGVYRDGIRIASVTEMQYAFDGLACGRSYVLGVDAVNARHRRSPLASIRANTTACTDTAPPSPPTGLKLTGATGTSLALSWIASTDDVGVQGYGLYVNGVYRETVPGLTYVFSALACGKAYSLGVDSVDSAENRSTIATLGASSNACASAPSPTYPINTAIPSLSGEPIVGSSLTASPGVWSGALPMTHAYQWSRCDGVGTSRAAIAGASAPGYLQTAADVGARLRVTVMTTNLAGNWDGELGPFGSGVEPEPDTHHLDVCVVCVAVGE